ncbi:vWA domain-containing protein [Granulibacter bethesdensis]|uniref:vWA domain-containing protein n=1 Tax=Granulibacter bethesdensis TaxID=364410 RepID=UPI00090B4F59|nr:vWA domain-containing protein [Granulibacter bethesdensis]APH58659.1 Hypothetical protein GbCGDNIH7_0351 [Granulibacter bethesdensis]
MMHLAIDRPWVLLAGLLALWPLLGAGFRLVAFPSVMVVPADRLSAVVVGVLRVLGAIAIIAVVLGLAGLHREKLTIQKVGQGAQIMLLIDRSISMDQTFDNQTPNAAKESKTDAAIHLVKDFFRQRPHDRFGVVAFSTSPILAMPLTEHRAAVEASLDAMRRPAIARTNIGRGLSLAFAQLQNSSPDAARVVLFVSDGAGVIDGELEPRLHAEAVKLGVHIYYLYLRTEGDPGLHATGETADADAPAALDAWFSGLGVPYKAFEADNPNALKSAVDTINRLEAAPIIYNEYVPREDYNRFCYSIAALVLAVLCMARFLERDLYRGRRAA